MNNYNVVMLITKMINNGNICGRMNFSHAPGTYDNRSMTVISIYHCKRCEYRFVDFLISEPKIVRNIKLGKVMFTPFNFCFRVFS